MHGTEGISAVSQAVPDRIDARSRCLVNGRGGWGVVIELQIRHAWPYTRDQVQCRCVSTQSGWW